MDKSIMWQYIAEEEKILKRLLDSEKISQVTEKITDIKTIYFVAHGSSYNACVTVSEFISKVASVKTHATTPAMLMKSYQPKLENKDETLILAISQTGTSRGVLEAVRFMKEEGFSILGISGVPHSKLCQMTDTILLECGEENSNAKTKGYSATLLLLMLIGLRLAQHKKSLSEEEVKEIENSLREEIDLLPTVEKQVKEWCLKYHPEQNIQNLYVLGYGMNYGTAMEAQLKLMETMCMPTMFNDIVEFSHGMHRSIDKNSTIWLLRFKDNEMSELTLKTYYYLKKITDKVFLINADDAAIEEAIHLKYFPWDHSVLLMTLVIQILSVYIPESHLRDPNVWANDDYTDYVQTRI